jgi:hypothetical protein
MTRFPMGLVLLVLPALLAGCGTSERSTSAAAEETPAVVAAAKTPATREGVAGNAAIAKISGIDACDEYLRVYERCVSQRLSGDLRTEHATKLERLRASLTKHVHAPDRPSTLEAKCKHGLASLPVACGS